MEKFVIKQNYTFDRAYKRKVAKRLKELRESRGITQEQLAEACDFSVEHIKRIEAPNTKNDKEFSDEVIYRASVVLDYPMCDFYKFEN